MSSVIRSFISLLRGVPRILRIAREWYFRQATRLPGVAARSAVRSETGEDAVGTDLDRDREASVSPSKRAIRSLRAQYRSRTSSRAFRRTISSGNA